MDEGGVVEEWWLNRVDGDAISKLAGLERLARDL